MMINLKSKTMKTIFFALFSLLLLGCNKSNVNFNVKIINPATGEGYTNTKFHISNYKTLIPQRRNSLQSYLVVCSACLRFIQLVVDWKPNTHARFFVNFFQIKWCKCDFFVVHFYTNDMTAAVIKLNESDISYRNVWGRRWCRKNVVLSCCFLNLRNLFLSISAWQHRGASNKQHGDFDKPHLTLQLEMAQFEPLLHEWFLQNKDPEAIQQHHKTK